MSYYLLTQHTILFILISNFKVIYMFDIGFFEILIVVIVAILALGPDKLPQFAMDAVKMFRSVKRAIVNAQESIESEVDLADMKADIQRYEESFKIYRR